MTIQDTRQIISGGAYDVLVIGGGVAGIAAAVAAARSGAKTCLVEKTIALGGLATIGLISWYEPLCDGEGHQMTGGIAEELLRAAIRYGYDDLPPAWTGQADSPQAKENRYATHFSPTMAMLAFDEYVLESGAELRLDTQVVCPVMEGNRCQGVLCETVSGREFLSAAVVVDASGGASVLHRAGVPTKLGENYLSFVAHAFNRDIAKSYALGGKAAKTQVWRTAGSSMTGEGHPEDMPLLKCETAQELTRFVLQGRSLLLDKMRNENREERNLATLPLMPQYRTIRRLVGEYTFTGAEEGQPFDDAVGSMGDFRTPGRRFQLPYRCLYSRGFPNLLAAGRIISAAGDGWEITRVIPVAALSGHAAGVAAAMACTGKLAVEDVDVKKLQGTLALQGVLFR